MMRFILNRIKEWGIALKPLFVKSKDAPRHGNYIYVIYDHPSENPDYWVVRAWTVEEWMPGKYQAYSGPACLFDSLEDARRFCIPNGFYRAISHHVDSESIAEVWL